MNISNSIRELVNTLKYSKKSSGKEYMLYLKLVILGVGVVGGVAFMIHLLSAIISQFLTPASSSATGAILSLSGLVA